MDGTDHHDAVRDLLHEHDFMEMFRELSFGEKIRKVFYGLKQPKDSGDYKYAKFQLMRMWAPVSAVVVPVIGVILLGLLGGLASTTERGIEVEVLEPEPVKELEEIKPLEQEKPPEPVDLDVTPVVTVSDAPTPGPVTEFSPQPASFDSVAIVKSPVIMKGIYGSRNPGARGVALKTYGGNILTEGAVLRALRWLKKFQEANGSWTESSGGGKGGAGAAPYAMTGFALLAFLGHGETPASEEFGETVEKAIQFLVQSQRPDGRWPQVPYQHQIATYALAEAYALTRNPLLKEAAEKGVAVIVQGQNPSGGWNYPLTPQQRDDTSIMAWCAQALKAAKMAGLEVPGLDECMKKAIEGFKKNADPAGGFGYASTGPEWGQLKATGLTGAGTLSMQFLGAAREKETIGGLKYLQERRLAFNWEGATWRDIYYWYYDTQARFHAGGTIWDTWNKMFSIPLVNAQIVLKGQGVDGKDIGYWSTGEEGHGRVMETALCTLMLEVYYRYLPTYRPPDDLKVDLAEQPKDEIVVQVNL
ncbi:MAG: terpene cyclase/mutase family protein [Kiritimatiellae bacterium]|nr:terpene cyclase/mutase family protein [Kiritimatiellia bacterium]